MRRPGDGFDGGGVVAEFPQGGLGQFIPDHQFVVVAAGSELAVFGVPAQAADLLLMADEFPNELIGLPDVTVVDETVARAGGEDVVVPGQGAYAGGVTCHGSEAAAFLCVPDLNEAFVCTYGDVGTALDPRDRGNDVVLEIA